MYFSKNILILEDNLRVLSKLLEKLALLDDDQPYSLCPIILTTQKQVEELLNSNKVIQFDICLLDRDTLDGSFHKLDIERFGAEKVIAISSVPEYNELLKTRGVDKVALKDLASIDNFLDEVIRLIADMIRELPDD